MHRMFCDSGGRSICWFVSKRRNISARKSSNNLVMNEIVLIDCAYLRQNLWNMFPISNKNVISFNVKSLWSNFHTYFFVEAFCFQLMLMKWVFILFLLKYILFLNVSENIIINNGNRKYKQENQISYVD